MPIFAIDTPYVDYATAIIDADTTIVDTPLCRVSYFDADILFDARLLLRLLMLLFIDYYYAAYAIIAALCLCCLLRRHYASYAAAVDFHAITPTALLPLMLRQSARWRAANGATL